MKELLKISGLFALLTVLIPMLVFIVSPTDSAADGGAPDVTSASEAPPPEQPVKPDYTEKYRVLQSETGQVIEMSMREYVKGAVFGEMPASYHIEALKAQAAAARTYAVRQAERQLASPDAQLKGAYVSDDSTKHQAFFTPAQAKAFYGEAYAEYDKKITEAVDAVAGEVIVYDGEPIVAAFHAVSSGTTESSEVVWGNRLEYLVPVLSEGDKNSPAYSDEKLFTAAEVKKLLEKADSGVKLEENEGEWLEITDLSPSGTVLKVNAGGVIMSGAEIRGIFSLRSACFDLSYDKTARQFTFVTRGSGHGVGLSQYGANEMALSGCTYKEIIAHYYTDTQIMSEYTK